MPEETQQAVDWALKQTVVYERYNITVEVTPETHGALVQKVGEYFNDHNIDYGTFSYADLQPYLT